MKNEIALGIEQDDIEDKLEEALDLKNKPKLARRDIKKIVREYREQLKDSKKAKHVQQIHQAVRAQLAKDDVKKVSLTDPDCRYMQSKKGPNELSYNVQTSVDSKHGIIVASDVCQEAADTHQGKPQLEQAEQNLQQPLPEGLKVCMDAGYDDPAILKWLEDRKFDAYIPLPEKGAKKTPESELYNKKHFVYNETADTFTCPEGKTLPYKSDYTTKRGKFLKMYYSFKACHYCPVADRCKSSTAENRVITATIYEGVIQRMKAKMQLEESKIAYSHRKELSELPYAHIKHNMGFTEFLTRGLKTVKNEWNLACAASNLRRIWSQIRKTGRGIQEITQSFWQLFSPA